MIHSLLRGMAGMMARGTIRHDSGCLCGGGACRETMGLDLGPIQCEFKATCRLMNRRYTRLESFSHVLSSRCILIVSVGSMLPACLLSLPGA